MKIAGKLQIYTPGLKVPDNIQADEKFMKNGAKP